MQAIQVADLKAHFSKILKTIKNDGQKYIIEYGKQHEKMALLIPYDARLDVEEERQFGLGKRLGSFELKPDFKMTDEEFLGL